MDEERAVARGVCRPRRRRSAPYETTIVEAVNGEGKRSPKNTGVGARALLAPWRTASLSIFRNYSGLGSISGPLYITRSAAQEMVKFVARSGDPFIPRAKPGDERF